MIFPEQIIRLTDLNAKALKPEIISELMEILQYRDIHDPDQWYKDGAIRIPKNTFKKLKGTIIASKYDENKYTFKEMQYADS